MIGTCKLCGQDKELIKQSHIIPNFMYKDMKHDNHMAVAYLKDLTRPATKAQTGLFDKHILCSHCDNVLIGDLEKYTAHIIYGNDIKNSAIFGRYIDPQGLKYISVKNIDYSKFKLCILSILWRAHISKNKFFKDINIEDNNEEAIRNMLLSQDSKDTNEYQIAAFGILVAEDKFMQIVVNPHVSNVANGMIATFMINGMLYYINLNPKSNFPVFEKLSLKKDELLVYLLEGFLAKEMVSSLGLPDYIVNYFYPIVANPF